MATLTHTLENSNSTLCSMSIFVCWALVAAGYKESVESSADMAGGHSCHTSLPCPRRMQGSHPQLCNLNLEEFLRIIHRLYHCIYLSHQWQTKASKSSGLCPWTVHCLPSPTLPHPPGPSTALSGRPSDISHLLDLPVFSVCAFTFLFDWSLTLC